MGEPGAFDDILEKMSGDTSKAGEEKPEPKQKSQSSNTSVKRLRPKVAQAKTAPFSQRIDIDVINALYDIAREQDWTMNRTLRETTKAFLIKKGDKSGGGL